MKNRIAVALLVCLLVPSGAWADTVWGTVSRSSSAGIDLNVMGQDGRYYPNTLPVRVANDTRFGGVRSASELSQGDMIRAEVRQEADGAWKATEVERAPQAAVRAPEQQFGTEVAPAPYRTAPAPSNALLDSLKSPQAQKMMREGLSGAVVGGVASAASGGKLGKGALIGAGTGVAAGLLTDYLQNRPAPGQAGGNFEPQRRVVRRYDENGNVVGEEEFTR
jgi:hypothetical protein